MFVLLLCFSMDDHIFDPADAEKMEDDSRYRFVSCEEILAYIEQDDTVIEVGSGTGFYTDDMARVASTVYAVDFQEAMHAYYRKKGVPANVELITSTASTMDLPAVDVIVSLFSFHEIDVDRALERFDQLLNASGTVVIFDWSSNGSPEQGPPIAKRYTASEAAKTVREWVSVDQVQERRDTFKIVASKNE